mgnify:CR=1 FL=1
MNRLKLDQQIIELKQKAEELKSKINTSNFSPKTNLVFNFNFTKKTNLRIFTVDELIQALAELFCKAEYWNKASYRVGLNRIFSYQGFTIEDIENDIISLAKQKEDEKTLSEIKSFISVLESKISEETKIKNEVDEISKYFDSLEQKLK